MKRLGDAAANSAPRVWAIGGGKGGVGKSVVASSLGIALARSDRRCVLVDADLGAANLHTLLGIPEPEASLQSFLEGEVRTLEGVACDTSIAGLRLVSGGRARVNSANPISSRKLKLLRHLRKLQCDEVIIDLAAGSSFNVLDFFLAADQKVVIVTPEATAMENCYHFIKAAWFRSLRPAVKQPEVREVLERVLAECRERRSLTPRALVEGVTELDDAAGIELSRYQATFRPGIVVNRVSSSAERRISEQIAQGCWEALGTRARSLGGIEQHDSVTQAVQQCVPILERFPDTRFSDDVYAMAAHMLAPDHESAELAARPRLRRLRSVLGFQRSVLESEQRARRLATTSALE